MPRGAILLAVDGPQVSDYERMFRARFSGTDVRVWPDRIGDKAGIAYACIWRAPHGLTATHQERVNADLLAFIRGE